MGDALFRYCCREITHQQLYLFGIDGHEARNPITWHDDAWAYCPAGLAQGHRWEHISAVPLSEVSGATVAPRH